jgi:hypothetical protein
LLTNTAVEAFARKIGVLVAGVLLDHVDEHIPQGERAA